MKRPVADNAATEAAVKAPHATPSQTRRVTRGDESSGSREDTFATVAAAVVVFPAMSTAGTAGAGGRAAAGAACPAAGVAGVAGLATGVTGAGLSAEALGGTGGEGTGGFVSSAMVIPLP